MSSSLLFFFSRSSEKTSVFVCCWQISGYHNFLPVLASRAAARFFSSSHELLLLKMVEEQSSFFDEENGVDAPSGNGEWRLPKEESGRGVWFSVAGEKGSRLAVKIMVTAAEFAMVEFSEGPRVVGSAPIDEITTVTAHEIFGGKRYEAKLEVTTRAATLVLWRDELSSAREAKEAPLSETPARDVDEKAVAAFLVAVGCQPQPRPSNSSRLGLGSRVTTYTTITASADDDKATATTNSTPATAKMPNVPDAVAEEKTTEDGMEAAAAGELSGDEERTTKQRAEMTLSEEEEDEAFEKLLLRGEKRWGGVQQDLPPSLRRKPAVLEADDDSSSSSSSRPSSFKTNKQLAYRGSWLAPVDDAPPVSFSKPLTKSPTPSPRNAKSVPSRRSFRSISSTDSLVPSPQKETPKIQPEAEKERARYRDALATATTSAAQKAADVSRAALSVHADAERLGAQLSTDVSTSELESNLSLAADGAKEARARLAALEREVALLAGPTLRELEWATQLRRTADARLAKHLASEWPRKGWVKYKCIPGSTTPPEKFWTERLWLELVDGEGKKDEDGADDSDASETPSPPTAKKVVQTPSKLVAKTSNSVVVFELELTAEVELRRCRERGAPSFALEVVPKAKLSTDENGRSASWYSAVASYFFDTFSSESVKDSQHFAFAPDSADEQRCWSLTIDAVLREAAIAKAIAAGDTHEESPDAPALAEPARSDMYDDVAFADAAAPEDDDEEFADVAAAIVVPEAAAPPAFADTDGESEVVVPPIPPISEMEEPTPYDGDDDKDVRPDDDVASVASSLDLELPPPPVVSAKQTGLSKLEAFKMSMTAKVPSREGEGEVNDDKDRDASGEKLSAANDGSQSKSALSRLLAQDSVSNQQQQDPVKSEEQKPAVSQLSLLERENAAHKEASSIFESQSLEAIIHEAAAPVAQSSDSSTPSMSSSSRAKFRVSASQRERLSRWRDKLANDVNATSSTRVSRSLTSSRSSRGRSLPPAKVQKARSRTGTRDDAYMVAPAPTPAPAPSSVAELQRVYRERTPEKSPKSRVFPTVESRRSSKESAVEKSEEAPTSVAELRLAYREQTKERPKEQSKASPADKQTSRDSVETKASEETSSSVAPSVAELRRAYREQTAEKASSTAPIESRGASGERANDIVSNEGSTPTKPSSEYAAPSVSELRRAYHGPTTPNKVPAKPKTSATVESRAVSTPERPSSRTTASPVVDEQRLLSTAELVKEPSSEQSVPSVSELRRAYHGPTTPNKVSAKPKAPAADESRAVSTPERPASRKMASPVVEEQRPASNAELTKEPSSEQTGPSVAELRRAYREQASEKASPQPKSSSSSIESRRRPSFPEKPLQTTPSAVEQPPASTTNQLAQMSSSQSVASSSVVEASPPISSVDKSSTSPPSAGPDRSIDKKSEESSASVVDPRRVSGELTSVTPSPEKTPTAVEPRRVSTAEPSPKKSKIVSTPSRDQASAEKAPEKPSSVAELRRAYREQNAPKPTQSPPTTRSNKRLSAARRLSQNQNKRTGGVSSMVVTKRQRNGGPAPAKLTTDCNKASASDMIRELERGAIVTLRFLPRTESQSERYEYECIDAFDFVDDETLAPLLQSHKRPTLARLYSAWRSEFSVKTDQNEFRGRLKELMASQARRWLASCSLLEVERPDETCVVVVRLHDDPNEYVQPIKFGDVVICWSPKRDDGSMTFADRATATPVVVANLSTWLDNHRVTAQRTLRIETANANQDVHSPLNYDYVYRKLFQKAVVK